MDRADRAFVEVDEQLKAEARNHNNASNRSFRSVKPEGFCHTCYEEVEGKKLFCDGKCASKFSG